MSDDKKGMGAGAMVGAAMAGAAVGAAAVFLSDKEKREMIKEKADDFLKEAQKRVEHTKHDLIKSVEIARKEGKKALADKLESASSKLDEASKSLS